MKAESSKTLIKSIIKRLKQAELDGTISELEIVVESGRLEVKYKEGAGRK